MLYTKIIAVMLIIGSVVGCAKDKTVDGGFDSKPLNQLKAGIWIDPNGCDHWIIDDGLEGYLSARLNEKGKPVCSGSRKSNTAYGGFKSGGLIPDII